MSFTPGGRRPVGSWQHCANPECKRKFRPQRSDTKTCSDACKKALQRARAAAEREFRAKRSAQIFRACQPVAASLYAAERDVEVIATPSGLLVAGTPGACERVAERLPGWRRTSVSLDELAGLIAPVPAPPRYTDPPKSMGFWRPTRRQYWEDLMWRDRLYRTAHRDFMLAAKCDAHCFALFTREDDCPD